MPDTWDFDGKLPEVLKKIKSIGMIYGLSILIIVLFLILFYVHASEYAYEKYQEEANARIAEEEERYNWFYKNATELDEKDEEILNENCGMIGRTFKGKQFLFLSTLDDIVEHGDSVYFYRDDSGERNYYRCSSSFIIDDLNGGKP
jgi:hypothetical protein